MVLHLGTNSVGRGASPPEIVADARKLVTRMLGLMPRLHVAVSAILPRAANTFPDALEPRFHPDELNRVALRTNRLMDDCLRTISRASFMRHPDFADSRGIRRDLLSRDGLHLSPRGGRVLSRYFLDSVAALSAAPAAPVDPAPPAPVEAIDAAPSPAPSDTSVPKTYADVVADGLPAPASAQRPTQRPAPRRHRRRRPARRTPRSAALPPPTATPPPATATPPPATSTPPPATSTPPPARKTPPPAKKTPPPATKTPPASKTPAASKTPLATTKTPPPATSTAPRTPSLRASPARSAVSRVKDASPHDSVLISVSDGVSVRLSAHLVKPVWDIQVNTCDAPPPVSQLRRKNNHVKKSKSPSLFSCPDCVRKFRTDYGLLEHIIRKHIVRQSTTPSTVKAPLIETVAHRGGGGTRAEGESGVRHKPSEANSLKNRGDCINSNIRVQQVYNIEYTYYNNQPIPPEVIDDPYRSEFMPPLSTIEEIKAISNAKFSPEELSNVIVIVDGQGFTYRFCKLLEESKIALQLIEEVSWLTSFQNSRVNVNSLKKMTLQRGM